MVTLIVLAAAWLVLRASGSLGVSSLNGWASSAPYALAVMFVFTASAHFTKMRHDLARMVPGIFPRPMLVIYITGLLELMGAAGLLIQEFRTVAAFCLILLLIAMFPANVKAAQGQLKLGGRRATALWLRTPMQALFIGLLWWSAIR